MAVLIGRPIDGIPINGNEYVVDEHGIAILFENEEQARQYLYDHSFTDEFIEDCGIVFVEENEDDEED